MAKTQVLPSSKGQVTLPISIRRKLNVGPNTVFDVSIKDESIILHPINLNSINDNPRLFSGEEIDEFLTADKISTENTNFFRKLLKK